MFDNIAELEKEVQEFEKNILASTQLVKSIDQLAKAADVQVRSFSKDSETFLRKIEQQNADAKDELHSDMETLLSDSTRKTQEEVKYAIGSAVDKIQQTRDEYAELIRKTEAMLKAHENELLSSMQSAEEKLIQIQRQYIEQFDKTEKALNEHEETVAKTILDDTEKCLADCNRALQNSIDILNTAQQQYVAKLAETSASLATREDVICSKMDSILERLDKLDFEDIRSRCDGIRKSINIKFTIAMIGTMGTLAFAALSFFMK